jgi:hypothetical protein
VESHNGRITVENLYNGEASAGCRFSFWIPLKPAPIALKGTTTSVQTAT